MSDLTAIESGVKMKFQTESTTDAFSPGDIVKVDSSGNIKLPDGSISETDLQGVCMSELPSLDSSAQRDIVVLLTGVVEVNCADSAGFSVGENVQAKTDGSGEATTVDVTSAAGDAATALGRVVEYGGGTEVMVMLRGVA